MAPSRLSIVAPYRDRAEHLARFLAHISLYFARDKIDKDIPYRVTVVEQEAGKPFNAGLLRNIGFLLTEAEAEQVCFHDIDCLPIWADYRPVERPTRLIWHGAEKVPLGPGSKKFIFHKHDEFFGAVVMFPCADFRRVNGYSNDYWGWGSEDRDLRMRCLAEGLKIGSRDGTYDRLTHVNQGHTPDGKANAQQLKNRALCAQRIELIRTRAAHREDGLTSARFEQLEQGPISDRSGKPYPNVERVLVRV